MAYSDESVTSKLSTLSETQDSIVATSQWLLFHRRHADRTASLWLQQLRKSPMPKRLNLVYLANEVVQQSKARGKKDFLLAFEPIIAEATGVAYEGQGESVRGKLRRVVEVWRQRIVFDAPIVEAVERRIGEIDNKKSTKGSGKLGGSLFGGGGGSDGISQELAPLAKSQATLSKNEVTKGPAVENAEREFAKLTDPTATLPTPPVHAARLSALMRNLQTAQGAVEACVNARRQLVEGLEKLLETNRAKLSEDESTMETLSTRREGIETKKREVEDAIMRGLSNPSSPAVSTPNQGLPQTGSQANGGATTSSSDPAAPEAESFTPPPPEVESFTPELAAADGINTGNLAPLAADHSEMSLEGLTGNPTGAEAIQEQPPNFNEPPPAFEPPPALDTTGASFATSAQNFPAMNGNDRIRQASTEIPSSAASTSADPRLKRRKTSHQKSSQQNGGDLDADLFGAGASGVDEEGISAMLAQ